MITSKMTSINTTKMPVIYKKIPFHRLQTEGKKLLDFGCGRPQTQNLIREHLSKYGIEYVPYDPYWCTEEQNIYAMSCIENHLISYFVSANVLNVLQDEQLNDTIKNINEWGFRKEKVKTNLGDIEKVFHLDCITFVSVYEGNKSGIGKQSKKDCWQRNESVFQYAYKFNSYMENKYGFKGNLWHVNHDVITNAVLVF